MILAAVRPASVVASHSCNVLQKIQQLHGYKPAEPMNFLNWLFTIIFTLWQQ